MKADRVEKPFAIAGAAVAPGTSATLNVPVPRLYTHTEMTMPVQVVRGLRPGPNLLICAALHGDELNGVEIIRRVMESLSPDALNGAVVAVPVVNVFGFISQSRYLPDRRDLNRSFPGSRTGSLAARLAYLFMEQVVKHCTHVIDFHTASNDRTNLAQIRANLEDTETRRCAEAFAAPVFMNSTLRDGSLREACSVAGIPLLVFEGGEPKKFSEEAIVEGVDGTLRLMQALGQVTPARKKGKRRSLEVTNTTWVRARQSGILHLKVTAGDHITRRQRIGFICDTVGDNRTDIYAPFEGIVIGHAQNPLVHRGDAVVHAASIVKPSEREASNRKRRA